jgi:hypothetical protein
MKQGFLAVLLSAVLCSSAYASSGAQTAESTATTGGASAPAETAQAAETAAAVGSWAETARRLPIPVFRPTRTYGLKLGFVNPIVGDPGCQAGRDQLRALYFGTTAGRTLEIFQGHPHYCLDREIDAPILRRVKVRGATATLHDLCGGRTCEPGFAARLLDWCEQGTSIQLLGVGITNKRLIAIARGMEEVRPRPARRCVPPGG